MKGYVMRERVLPVMAKLSSVSHVYSSENMKNKTTLRMIQDDIHSIKSQIDILRMETRAHRLDCVAYLLDLAWHEALNSEVAVMEGSGTLHSSVTLQ